MPTDNGNKLRIAQIAPLWTAIPPDTYGGIELLLALLCDGLCERGHEVTLFASGDCKTRAKLRAVIPVNLSELMARGDALMHEYYLNAAVAEALAAQDEFDLLHFHLSPALLPLASSARKPCLFTWHTSPHADDEWAMRKFPDVAVAAISRAQFARASQRLGREFPVVPNGIDFAAYEPSFERGKYLAFLGRMSPEKNPRDAILIARAVGMPIILAGRPQNAAEDAYFEREVKPLVDGERVRWIGPADHDQKSALLRGAAALLFPITWDEPFGLVMIEAMACGCPVLGVARGSVREVIDEGKTGLIAESPMELVDHLPAALLLDRATVRSHAESRFSHHAMIRETLALYNRLLLRS